MGPIHPSPHILTKQIYRSRYSASRKARGLREAGGFLSAPISANPSIPTVCPLAKSLLLPFFGPDGPEITNDPGQWVCMVGFSVQENALLQGLPVTVVFHNEFHRCAHILCGK